MMLLISLASLALADDPAVATVRTVEVVADLDESRMRLVVTSSGDHPNQRIDGIQIWLDDSEVSVPRRAFNDAWNPNPAAWEIRKRAGLKRELLPPEANPPLMALTVEGYDGEEAATLFIEDESVVFSYVRTLEILQCRSFDSRYESHCESVNRKIQELRKN
jgi:hypothetical protein